MPPSFFSPDTTWTGTQILLSEQHCRFGGLFCTRLQAKKAPLGRRGEKTDWKRHMGAT